MPEQAMRERGVSDVLWRGPVPAKGGVTVVGWTVAGEPQSALLWFGAEGWQAWRNRCPHWGVEMGRDAARLLDETGALTCGLHGARFSPEDGRCLEGPCVGAGLDAMRVQVEEGTLVIRAAPRVGIGRGAPRLARRRDV